MKSTFTDKLRRPQLSKKESPWAFVILPKSVSDTLPRRGRTTVNGTLNGQSFQATLEPDGQLSHWLRIEDELLKTLGVDYEGEVTVEIAPVELEPEPEIPFDLQTALKAKPEAWSVWLATTTIARLDWCHWVTSAKQEKTRVKRINDACEMLASGKKRVCCFDQSGFYSKAFGVPKELE